ncbi:MAG: single-stranded DNA-binding protein [Microbacterium sp. 69-10]|uniref:single-stranded DNA-binding protein n=1 Tax=Microbacterium sp. 69-10 TaxID=1895783 RepID=UPI0009597C12|nr:single-stranded DNA-binding protein [Microbacterium sp. 69-10]OJU41519.1 MAG: single-stranded DNA-binding protein [Microbacterium sp. 69-10]
MSSIETKPSVTGFIATEPKLSRTEDGTLRFYARIGIEHSRQEPDGSWTQLETTFHDMAAFRRAAEEGHKRFHKGDKFVASGRVHEYTRAKDGEAAEEFIVSSFGHDIARTQYEVHRAPRQSAPSRGAGFGSKAQSARGASPAAMGM